MTRILHIILLLTLTVSHASAQSLAPIPAAEPPDAARSATGPAVADAEPTTLAAMEKKLADVAFHEVELTDCVDYLRDESGAQLYADWRALADAGVKPTMPVTFRGTGVTAADVLDAILKPYQKESDPIVLRPLGHVVVISTADGAERLAQRKLADANMVAGAPAEFQKLLGRALPEVRFDGTAFSDVAEFLRDVGRVDIYVNWSAMKHAGVNRDAPVVMRLRDVPFIEVLRLALHDVGSNEPLMLVIEGEPNTLTITTAEAHRDWLKLREPASIDAVKNQPLEDALRTVLHGRNLSYRIERGTFEQVNVPIDAVRVSVPAAKDAPLHEILSQMVRQVTAMYYLDGTEVVVVFYHRPPKPAPGQ